jgi:hypothetical protein
VASSELGDLKTPKFNGMRAEDLQLWALLVEAIMRAKGVLELSSRMTDLTRLEMLWSKVNEWTPC